MISVPATAFALAFDPRGRHVFCGKNDIPGARCPNCERPMLQMMSLDASDERLQLGDLRQERVPLLFCWRCNLAQDLTQYRLRRDGGIDLLLFQRGTQGPGFPYANYPESFPEARFNLTPMPTSPATSPRHQIGGTPFIQQVLHKVRCMLCRQTMQFLACVADDASEGWTFAGNSGVQVLFHVCQRDGVVASYHECD